MTVLDLNRQLHDIGDLVEYFFDSFSITGRNRRANLLSIIQHPNIELHIPKQNKLNPRPSNTNAAAVNLDICVVLTTNMIKPPIELIKIIKLHMIRGFADIILLIFVIDSSNSVFEIIPLRRVG